MKRPCIPFAFILFATMGASLSASAYDTRIVVHPLTTGGSTQPAPSDVYIASTNDAPFNIAETFAIGSRDYLFLMSSESGRAVTLELSATGHVVGQVETMDLSSTGWRSATITRAGGVTRLTLYAQRDGYTRRFFFRSNGTLDYSTRLDRHFADLEDKNLVSAYSQGSLRRAFALDTFSGRAMVHTYNPQSELTEATYSKGWTDLDHLSVDGTAYRLLYKEVGSPFLPSSQSTEGGRTVVMRLGSNGLGVQNVLTTDIGAGWTSVRFVRLGANSTGLLAYDRRSGATQVRRFLSEVPGPITFDETGNLGMEFDVVRSYREGGTTYALGIEFDTGVDEVLKLDGEVSARLAHCVEKKVGGRVAGYQLSVLQNGLQIMNRAVGYKNLAIPFTPLQTDDRLNYGSVAKMFTTVSAMKAHELGYINLDSPLAWQLDEPQAGFASWMYNRTPRDLLAQVSGFNRSIDESFVCVGDHPNYTVDCTTMFTNNPPEVSCNSSSTTNQFACPYAYYNANFGALRQVIERPFNVSTTPDFNSLTNSLWLNGVMQYGPSCQESNVKKFRMCSPGDTCFTFNGNRMAQYDPSDPGGWSISCAAGGWHMAAKDAVHLFEQLRERQILNDTLTDQLYATNWRDQDGARTGHGWENPYTARTGGARVLGKDGGTAYAKAYVTNLEGHGTASLVFNTGGGAPSPTSILQTAYSYAIDPSASCDSYSYGYEVDRIDVGAASESVSVMMGTGQMLVAAVRDSAGDLRLKSYSVADNGELQSRGTVVTEAASQISIARLSSTRFVVGFKNASGNFKLRMYNVGLVSGTMSFRDSYSSGAVRGIQLVSLGNQTVELAAVLKTGSSRLQVIAFDMSGSQLLRRHSYTTSGTVKGVSAAARPNTGRLVTAIRTSAGKIKLIAFDISSDGSLVDRVGSSASADAMDGSNIRIGYVAVPSGHFFVTSMKNSSGNLHTRVWAVSSSGSNITLRTSRTDGAVATVGTAIESGKTSFVYIPFVNSSDQASVMPMTVSNNGLTLTKLSSLTAKNGDDATKVDVSPYFGGGENRLGLVYVADGDFRVSLWRHFPGD